MTSLIPTLWTLMSMRGGYADRNNIDGKFQLVLPNSASRTDSCTLFV